MRTVLVFKWLDKLVSQMASCSLTCLIRNSLILMAFCLNSGSWRAIFDAKGDDNGDPTRGMPYLVRITFLCLTCLP